MMPSAEPHGWRRLRTGLAADREVVTPGPAVAAPLPPPGRAPAQEPSDDRPVSSQDRRTDARTERTAGGPRRGAVHDLTTSTPPVRRLRREGTEPPTRLLVHTSFWVRNPLWSLRQVAGG